MVKFNYLFSFYNFLLFAQSNKKYKFYERSRVEIEKIKRKLLAGIEKKKNSLLFQFLVPSLSKNYFMSMIAMVVSSW